MRIDTLGQGLLMQVETYLAYSKSGAVPLSQWVLGTTTYDGANMRVYLNGVEEDSTALVTTITTNDHPLYIGTIPGLTGYEFDGQLDDIRLYNRALSAAEVMQLYRETRIKHSSLLNYIEPAEFNAAGHVSPHYYHHLLAG